MAHAPAQLAGLIATILGAYAVLPCGASLVTVFTNWSFDSRKIRLGKLLLSCPAWVLYDLHVGSFSGILCELTVMGSALLAVLRCREAGERA